MAGKEVEVYSPEHQMTFSATEALSRIRALRDMAVQLNKLAAELMEANRVYRELQMRADTASSEYTNARKELEGYFQL